MYHANSKIMIAKHQMLRNTE